MPELLLQIAKSTLLLRLASFLWQISQKHEIWSWHLKISTGPTVYTLIREFKNESASIHAKFVVVKMRSIRLLLIINLLWLI